MLDMSQQILKKTGYIVLNVTHLKSRGDDHQLLLVIGRGHTLEGLQPLQSVLATLGLVGGHATDLVKSSMTKFEKNNQQLTVRQKILDGALKWKGPREGLTLQRFFKKSRYFSLLR